MARALPPAATSPTSPETHLEKTKSLPQTTVKRDERRDSLSGSEFEEASIISVHFNMDNSSPEDSSLSEYVQELREREKKTFTADNDMTTASMAPDFYETSGSHL